MAVIRGTTHNGEVIDGTGSDDHIIALSGNDTIYGGAGNDRINANRGDDHVTGESGDDFLLGNGGADTFHYSFSVTTGGSTSSPGAFVDLDGDGELTKDEFVHQYNAWLVTLGVDTDADDEVAVDNNHGSATELPTVEGFEGTFGAKLSIEVHAGRSGTHPAYYCGSATTAGVETVTSTDGHDVIGDFHVGLDALALGGLTEAQFLEHFEMNDTADVNGDLVNDTVITISGDETFSITLLGVNGYSLADFYG